MILLGITVIEFSLDVHVRFISLYSGRAGVQQCMVVEHFRHRCGATQAANRPSLAYYNTDNSIFNTLV